MNFHPQQLHYINNEIVKIKPNDIIKSSTETAIIIHIFYIDIWQEIINYLKHLDIPYDLYITVPDSISDKDIIQIFKDVPNITIYMTENRGRDVLPFLQVMHIIGIDTYKYICKMHTKKTGKSDLGSVWRKLLYYDLIGSTTTVHSILRLFKNNDNIGMVTGKNSILDSKEYLYGNQPKIELLKKECHIKLDQNYHFAAGTMFWIKAELLEQIINLFKEEKLNFESEEGQTDNTLAHAIERFFGLICQYNNKQIVESPSLYSNLSDNILNEVTSLVLSQQYIDTDVYNANIKSLEKHIETLDKETTENITKQQQYIKNLEELAESMRIKNRLKKLIPQNIASKLKKILSILKTVKSNPLILKKVFYYLSRGDISYLLTKIKEKSRNNLRKTAIMPKIETSNFFKEFDIEEYSLQSITIDIIIPVYNGYEYLQALFDSLEKNTSSSYRLIIINDCSPDRKVKPYLKQRLEKHINALFIDNENNLGFVKSVIKAVSHVKNHFVILNTDTELPLSWLEKLMFPIIDSSNIASTTPFTNSGQIASFPNFLEDNKIFEDLSVNELDKVFSTINPTHFYTELPTAVGFCMGVNYKLVQEIGFFDEKTFSKGYGEENDWCQRAIQNGYTNIFVPNLFVYHKHGGSFSSDEKKQLIAKNHMKLLKKHPQYDIDVQKYIQKNPHEILRNILIMVASSQKTGIHLIFDHSLGGGANIYTNELQDRYIQEKRNTLLIRYDFYTNDFKLYYKFKTYVFNFRISNFDELKVLISKLTLKEIFLNSIVSYKQSYEFLNYFNSLIKVSGANLVLPIHDFYSICPSFTLLNAEGNYCDIPSLDICKSCIKNNTLEWKNLYSDKIDIALWRDLWFNLLEKSSSILCFSNSSKEILCKAYPTLNPSTIKVIPHIVEAIEPVILEQKKPSNTIVVGVLGAINHSKGSKIVKELVQKIEKENLNINVVIIGEISEQIKSKHFHVTGRYKHHELHDHIKKHHIDIFLIPSICPETFSYTTQEIIMMEMPLIVFNLGAPAARVADYVKGYVVNTVNAEAALDIIKKFKEEKN